MQPALCSASAAMRWEPALPPLFALRWPCPSSPRLPQGEARRGEACAARRLAPLFLDLDLPGVKLGLVFFALASREGNTPYSTSNY